MADTRSGDTDRGGEAVASATKLVAGLQQEFAARPFIIPAMGSHGGATAESQKNKSGQEAPTSAPPPRHRIVLKPIWLRMNVMMMMMIQVPTKVGLRGSRARQQRAGQQAREQEVHGGDERQRHSGGDRKHSKQVGQRDGGDTQTQGDE